MATSAASKLRALLREPEVVMAPGAYDAITARLIEQAGFSAVYMTGGGTSLARGFPDYGILTLTEMVENAAVLAHSVDIPLISDADTGYGNELNVTRTVREFESRGVAAIHIEDQMSPKRCGHLDGKEVVSREEFISKIRAAVAARRDPDFVIIARSDANATAGLDEAVERVNRALEAGADLAFVEALRSMEELAAVPKRVNGDCLLNAVQGGKTPLIDMNVAREMGYRLAIMPSVCLLEVVSRLDGMLRELKSELKPAAAHGATVNSVFQRFGAGDWDVLRRQYDADPFMAAR